jgi:hypothetical protein
MSIAGTCYFWVRSLGLTILKLAQLQLATDNPDATIGETPHKRSQMKDAKC